MDKRLKYGLCLAVLSVSFVSCEDFLDKDPDNRVYLDTPEFIENLLATAYTEADIAFAEAMSDCAGDRGLDAILDDPEVQQSYLWSDVVETWQGTPAYYWNESYKAIAAANHALEAIEKFEAEGRGTEVRYARGEALLCRAYAHFMLANVFCMPYDPATASTELGVPYVTKPETTLNPSYERETLEETYRLIEKDLTEGLELLPATYENAPAYHFTRKAAYAFASRFYLWKGGEANFLRSLLYANKVLGDVKSDNPSSMLRQINDPSSDYMGDYYDGQMLYTSSAEPANLLLVAAASNMYYQPYWRYGMTVAIRTELYKNGIFGYSWAYQTSGGYDYLIHRPLWTYYFQQDGLNANYGVMISSIPLLTTEEVLLNRAEVNALLHNYEDALIDMNTFLSTRLNRSKWDGKPVTAAEVQNYFGINPVNLPAWRQYISYFPYFCDFKDEANLETFAYINAILTMRKAEFLGTGLRWFDVRRYDIPVVHMSVTHPTDTLVSGDRRRACQIPDQAQGNGIKPNPGNDIIPESAKNAAIQLHSKGWDGIISPNNK